MANLNRNKEKLAKALHEIMMGETRLWLLHNLLKLELVTWDIYNFARKQAELRTTLKSLDWPTMKAALKIKIRDTLLTLTKQRREKSWLEQMLQNSEGSSSIKHLMRPLNKPIKNESFN